MSNNLNSFRCTTTQEVNLNNIATTNMVKQATNSDLWRRYRNIDHTAVNQLDISTFVNERHDFRAPKRLANKDDMIFISSSLVSAQYISVVSMFSSSSSSLSASLPCNTTVRSKFSLRY